MKIDALRESVQGAMKRCADDPQRTYEFVSSGNSQTEVVIGNALRPNVSALCHEGEAARGEVRMMMLWVIQPPEDDR